MTTISEFSLWRRAVSGVPANFHLPSFCSGATLIEREALSGSERIICNNEGPPYNEERITRGGRSVKRRPRSKPSP